MPLTLVLGPANSAKAGEVLGAYAAAARRGAVLVVPTAADADHYARELAGEGAVLGSVLTFAGLAIEIARRAGYAGRRLSRLQRERVLRARWPAPRSRRCARSARTAGFPAAAGELIAELERALVTPAAVRRGAGGRGRRRTRAARPYATDVGRALPRLRRRARPARPRRRASCSPGGRSTRCGPRPGGGAASRCSSTASTTCTALERDAVETLARSRAPK